MSDFLEGYSDTDTDAAKDIRIPRPEQAWYEASGRKFRS